MGYWASIFGYGGGRDNERQGGGAIRNTDDHSCAHRCNAVAAWHLQTSANTQQTNLGRKWWASSSG